MPDMWPAIMNPLDQLTINQQSFLRDQFNEEEY